MYETRYCLLIWKPLQESPLVSVRILDLDDLWFVSCSLTLPLKNHGKPNIRPWLIAIRMVWILVTEETKKQVEDLVEMRFVWPRNSPWASPGLLAIKKDGIIRIFVGYRELNRSTAKNSYLRPCIDGWIYQTCNTKIFRTINLRNGYYQMRIAPNNIPNTTFSTIYGHYEFNVVLIGLKNAPAAFMSIMNDVFKA